MQHKKGPGLICPCRQKMPPACHACGMRRHYDVSV